MKAGGHKTEVVFVDRTTHQIPHDEQDELIKRAPAGAVKMTASEAGHPGDGTALRLEVIRKSGEPLVCKVVAQNCVEALDKLRACLEWAKTTK